jgi:PAS domain S-box-containing protein
MAEYRIRRPDGTQIWIHDESRYHHFDAEGRPTLAQGVMFDVTERTEAEARAHTAEERFRTLVERVPAISYSWDSANAPGTVPADYISPQIEELVGVPARAWLDDPSAWAKHVHPDDLERVNAAWDDATDVGDRFLQEYRLRTAEGAWLWVRDEANPVATARSGKPLYQGVIIDISERHEAEGRVREAEQRWRLLLENLPVVSYQVSFDADGTLTDRWIASGIVGLLGCSVETWLHDIDSWDGFIHPEDRDLVLAAWAVMKREGTPFDLQYRMVRVDGHEVWVHDRAAFTTRDGAQFIQGAFLDITGRHNAEVALGRAEDRFRTLVEQLPAITFIEDVDTGENIYISPQIEAVYGFTQEEWTADPHLWERQLHPDDHDWVVAANAEDAGDSWSVDYRSLTRKGKVLWVHNEARLIRSEDGEPLYWQGVLYDITERKHAEERLRAAEERYRTLIEQLPVAIYTDAVDDVSTALYISPQYEQLTGYSPEQRLMDPDLWVNMLHPEDRDGVLAESERTNITGEPFDIEYRIVAADGRTVWLHDHAMQVRDAAGDLRWHGVLQDVTESRLAQDEVARRDAILEATSFAAERFLRSAAWEDVLHEVLERLGLAGAATRCAVFRNHANDDGTLAVSVVDGWVGGGHNLQDDATLAGFAWEAGGFGRWAELMSARRAVHGVVSEFPEHERRLLEGGAMPIRSLIAMPIFADDIWWGYISFDHVDEDRRWGDAEIEALAVTANTLGAAIDRERATTRLSETQARYQTLIEQIPALTYIEDLETGEEIYISPQIESLLGYSPDEWGPHERWTAALHPSDRERVLAEDEACNRSGEPFHSEYRLIAKDGRTVWFRDDATLVRERDGVGRYWQGVRFDITAEKESELQLREAEERYRLLVEKMPAITYLDEYDPGTDLWPTRYVSPQIETIVGYPAEEWLANQLRWREMIHPDDREAAAAADRAHYTEGTPLDIELRIYTKTGDLRWLRDQAVIVRDDDGRPRFSQGIMQDVTDRKLAELAMHDAERRYRTLIESIPAVTFIDSLEEPWPTLYVSPQVKSTFGYDADEWHEPGLWIGRVHPDDAERAREAIRQHSSTQTPFDLEYRFQHRDGHWLWIREQAFVVHDEDGTPLFSQGVMYDITATKEAEERLRDAEQRYRAIVEHVPAAIYLDRPDGAMESIYVSPQIADIAGVSPEEWIADPQLWLSLMDPEDRELLRATYARAVTEREPWKAEYRIHTPDGRTVWIHDETTFLLDPDGQPMLLQGVMFDITERKLAEQALRESEQRERDAAERLRALDDMKNTFLAAVSHELRSPLTSILGLSLTLERADDLGGADRTDLLGRLASNARKLDRLLKDLLDIDRLNRGIVEPQYRVTDVGALARRIVENLDALAGREVIVRTDPVVIPIDPPKVERIVENLLMNAVRHTTNDRKIWLTVGSHEGGVRISVEDDGTGVPGEIRAAIFEPFRQGPTQSPHAPGTGIGLSLVARFAELHGGRAWVDEREGGGAAFHVVIPGRVPNHPDGDAPDAASRADTA